MRTLVITVITTLSILFAISIGLLVKTRSDVNEKEIYISSLYGELNRLNEELYDANYSSEVIDSLNIIIDSKTHICDSLKGELDVVNFKLERIKYYNDVAAKNNNIKFLRGWINRVIND